jgi:hypothetical protein
MVKGAVGGQIARQVGVWNRIKAINRRQFPDSRWGCRLRRFLRGKAIENFAVFAKFHNIPGRNRRDQIAFAGNAVEPVILGSRRQYCRPDALDTKTSPQ